MVDYFLGLDYGTGGAKSCVADTSTIIKGIVLSFALPCIVMIDKEGNPIGNAYNLMDRRGPEEVQ
jgi:sugar (pentulose or hexulose) kinase